MVAEVFPRLCRVRMDGTGHLLLCPYRRAQVYNRKSGEVEREHEERSPVAVGDRVKVQVFGSQDGVVEGVADRGSTLMRMAPGREGAQVHVLASNVDLLVIVAAVRSPDFSPGLIDRFLVAGQVAGIKTLICMNKMDLRQSDEKPWSIYEQSGVEVVNVSAKGEPGIGALIKALDGKLAVFCGHSGVGKTSILKVLLGREVGRIGEVSESSGKGKHTTTGALLLEGANGTRVIDTPGVREFGLVGIAPEDLQLYFPEFKELGCPVRGCLHDGEEGCKASGQPRYSSYKRILNSVQENVKVADKPWEKKAKRDRKSPSR